MRPGGVPAAGVSIPRLTMARHAAPSCSDDAAGEDRCDFTLADGWREIG